MSDTAPPAHAAGTFAIGGELTVHRLGFGAMRLPGVRDDGDPLVAHEMLRAAVRLGVDFIDTAQAYGDSELLIADALHPYPEGLVIATKGGLRPGGIADGRPEFLRAGCEASLKRLRVDRIDLWQLHRVDGSVPLEEQLGAIAELRDEGKIRFAGLSEVSAGELRQARELIDIATVQNRFNHADRRSDAVLAACEAGGIGFIPWSPLARGELNPQEALAWLLNRSPVMLPIPGTGSPEHMRENIEAALLTTGACARCGAAFECGLGTGTCWCAAVELSAEQREAIAAAYEDCLCPKCLTEAANAPAR